MFSRPRPSSRHARGFTLIELLAVITIIAILAAMTFSLYGAVQTSRREAKARAEIKALEVKLEEFKGRYGEFPMAETASEDAWERALFNALTGRWAYRKIDGKITWDKTKEGASEETLRPFLSSGEVGTDANPDSAKAATKFVDPWGNAYRYRYGKLNASTGKPDSGWDRAGMLLISAGAKFSDPAPESESNKMLPDTDFFPAGVDATGVVDDKYFDDPYRVDNLTNFGVK